MLQQPGLAKFRRFLPIVIVLVVAAVAYAVFKPSGSTPTAASASGAQALSDAQVKQFLLQHYGSESRNATQTALVSRVGTAIATRSDAKDAKKNFYFHLLTEPNVINVFSIPGGDVYVTTALVNRMRTEGELAAALSSGVAHVMEGDAMKLSSGGQLEFTVAQETTADAITVKLMSQTGYDPTALLGLFHVLTDAYRMHADVPFFATHPSADGRLTLVANAIAKLYPAGVPSVLSK